MFPLLKRLRPIVFAALVLAATTAQASPAHDELIVRLDRPVAEHRADKKFRTLETIDLALAKQLAQALGATLHVSSGGDEQAHGLRLTTLRRSENPPTGMVAIRIGHRSAAAAIMPNNTTVHSWRDLKGRPVCVVQGNHVGIGKRFGAVEKVYSAPADALIALRTGACAAAVQDSAVLDALSRLPEWGKFSARLAQLEAHDVAFLVPATEPQRVSAIKKAVADWKRQGLPQVLVTQTARSIAFEVYLDQDVPDCH